MSFKELQTLFEYEVQPWSKVRQGVLALAKVAKHYSDESRDFVNTIWWYGQEVGNLLEAGEKGEYEFLPYQKHSIGLIDVDLINSFLSQMEVIDKQLTDVSTAGSVMNSSGLSSPDWQKLELIGLSKNVLQRWQKNLSFLPVEKQQALNIGIEKVLTEEGEIHYQLAHLGVVLNIAGQSLAVYTLSEVEKILQGGKEYEQLRFIKTIIQNIRSENRQEAARIFSFLLNDEKIITREEYSWEDVLIFSLVVHLLFFRLETLPEEEQMLMIRHYIFRAFLFQIDVAEKLKAVLFKTLDTVSYVLLNYNIFESFIGNDERVLIDVKGEAVDDRMLGLVLNNYFIRYKADYADALQLKGYIEEIYSISHFSGKQALISWLQNIFHLAISLKDYNLIESNIGGELYPHEAFRNEFLELIANFGIGESGADILVDYFQKDGHNITLETFLYKIKKLINLGEEVAVNNCLEISEVFKQENLIADDLVVFDESKGKFVWNEEVFK